MLKISTHEDAQMVRLQIEGALVGCWVKELELCWRSAASTQRIYPVRVDLSSVTFIDADGKALLGRMYREGAQLVATESLNKYVVEGLMPSEEKMA